ncbi:MAG: hypothetical protein HZC49_06535 [Nitrospirae bacterium]|nr:hypothetical protein [Nitrospirota bacterium]
MGSDSDLPVMDKAAEVLKEMVADKLEYIREQNRVVLMEKSDKIRSNGETRQK